MAPRPQDFPNYSVLDEDAAVRLALARVVRDFRGFEAPGVRSFKPTVYEEWPEESTEITFPSIVLLDARGRWTKDMGNDLIEETVWPAYGPTKYVLRKDADYEVTLQMAAMGNDRHVRGALISGMRRALMSDPDRFGIIVEIPEYWGLQCRLTPMGIAKVDTEDEDRIRHRLVTVEVACLIASVTLVSFEVARDPTFRLYPNPPDPTNPVPEPGEPVPGPSGPEC